MALRLSSAKATKTRQTKPQTQLLPSANTVHEPCRSRQKPAEARHRVPTKLRSAFALNLAPC